MQGYVGYVVVAELDRATLEVAPTSPCTKGTTGTHHFHFDLAACCQDGARRQLQEIWSQEVVTGSERHSIPISIGVVFTGDQTICP